MRLLALAHISSGSSHTVACRMQGPAPALEVSTRDFVGQQHGRGQSEHAPLIAAPSSLGSLNMPFTAAAICGLKQCDGWSTIPQGTASRASTSKPALMQGSPTPKEPQCPDPSSRQVASYKPERIPRHAGNAGCHLCGKQGFGGLRMRCSE